MGRVHQVNGRKFLVDTHILLWAVSDDKRLAPRHRSILANNDGLFVSVVSIWEIAIKRSLGKLDFDGDMIEATNIRGIPLLAINEHHAARVEHLGHHHGDPFDRMLIAQAQVENLTILTADPQFSRYDVLVI